MLKIFNKKLRNRKGFTLVELIVVIAILGILAGIAVPRLSGFQEKARTSADEATLDTIERAIAIGVADESLKAGTVIATASSGSVTFSGTAATDVDDVMATLIDSSFAFKKSTHAAIVITWTIKADGTITRAFTTGTW